MAKTNFKKLAVSGFTLIELVIAMTLLALAVSLSISAVNYGDRAKSDVANELISRLSAIEGAFNLYYADKSTYPVTTAGNTYKDALNDTSFVPQYLFIPPASKAFLGTWTVIGSETGGTLGWMVGLKTGAAAPNNGYYVCAKAADATVEATDLTYMAVLDAAGKMSSNKMFYGASCPVVANTAASGGVLYVTYWLTRY